MTVDAVVLDGDQRSALAVIRSPGRRGIRVAVGAEVEPARGRPRTMMKTLHRGTCGRDIRNPALPACPESSLFVCQGNTCRGPFASGMMGKLSGGTRPARCGSAGTSFLGRSPSPGEAVEAPKRFGVDLGSRLSRPIGADKLESYDMILVMETGQRHPKRNFPAFRKKVLLLPLFDSADRPEADRERAFRIRDPYGMPVSSYLECHQRITDCLEGLLADIRK